MKGHGTVFEMPVLYHSRRKRPSETEGEDFYFRSHDEIGELGLSPDYKVFEIRDQKQAIDLPAMKDLINNKDVVYEGPVKIAMFLKTLAQEIRVECRDVFLSPMSQSELQQLSTVLPKEQAQSLLIHWMAKRLRRRYYKQKQKLEDQDYKDIQVRSEAIWEDLSAAPQFSKILVNHDGEDSDHWDAFPFPVGEAGRSVRSLVNLVARGETSSFETWTDGVLEVADKK